MTALGTEVPLSREGAKECREELDSKTFLIDPTNKSIELTHNVIFSKPDTEQRKRLSIYSPWAMRLMMGRCGDYRHKIGAEAWGGKGETRKET